MASFSIDIDISAAEAGRGFKTGILTFVVGMLASVLLVNPKADDEVFENTDEAGTDALTYGELDTDSLSPPGDFELAGWLYHKSHFASIDVSLGSGSGDDLAFAMDPGLVLLVPILVLLAAGFFLAARGTATTRNDSAVNGALVFLGYLPVAYVSTHVLYYEADARVYYVGIEAQPDATSVVLFTGLLFPIVFGAIGGAIEHAIGDHPLDADGR